MNCIAAESIADAILRMARVNCHVLPVASPGQILYNKDKLEQRGTYLCVLDLIMKNTCETQSAHIRERIAQFDNKLYLEFGGKLFDDYHASRVLPGFHPDSKTADA